MKYDASYKYYAEDINKVGNKFSSPEEAYDEARIDLNKLGYEVTELDSNLQFDYISKSTGVRYEGNIGVLYDEPKLEDGWMFEIEDDGRRVIYKEDNVYGNVVISKLLDGYYEFEDDEGGFPEVFPNLRRLTIKKRLHIPNSVVQELEGNNDMSVKTIEESLKAELKKVYEDAEEYKEYNFTFTKDYEGNVTIDATDFEGQYKEWQNEEDDEEMENVIDIAKDEKIKDDIEELEGKSIDYVDITDFDYDESDMAGSFTLGVTFDVSFDEALEPQVNSVGDIVAENAEVGMKSIAAVIDYIEDAEVIAKLEEAAELLRQMVPHLQ